MTKKSLEFMQKAYPAMDRFMVKLANQDCEAGPFPITKLGKTVYVTCLEISPAYLEQQSGMTSPCWPCQSRRVLRRLLLKGK